MISVALIKVLNVIDDSITLNLDKKIISLIIFFELIFSLILYWYCRFFLPLDNLIEIFVVVLYAVYTVLTGWIDWKTCYVYRIINILSAIVIILVGFSRGIYTSYSMFFGSLFVLFVYFCQRIKAFCVGDSGVFIVSYLFFSLIFSQTVSIEFMLMVMLFSSISFGIFRRKIKRKEALIPFTPFIFSSEYILIIFLCFIKQ